MNMSYIPLIEIIRDRRNHRLIFPKREPALELGEIISSLTETNKETENITKNHVDTDYIRLYDDNASFEEKENSYRKDPVFIELVKSDYKQRFYNFFEKKPHCSLYHILAGIADRHTVMRPDNDDMLKIKIMEEVLNEAVSLLENSQLTKKAYNTIKNKLDAGTLIQDTYSEVMKLFEEKDIVGSLRNPPIRYESVPWIPYPLD